MFFYLLAASLLGLQGCELLLLRGDHEVRSRPPNYEAFKKSLGTVGISVLPETGGSPPSVGVSLVNLISSTVNSDVSGETFLFVVAGTLAAGTISGIGEGVYKTVEKLIESKSVPREKVLEAEKVVKRAMAGVNSEKSLLRAFAQQAAARKDMKLIVIGDGDSDDVDTLLSVRVLYVGMAGRRGRNPDIHPVIRVQYWLARNRRNHILKDGFTGYANKKSERKFIDWAEDGARPLLKELEASYSPLAESVLEAVLGPPR